MSGSYTCSLGRCGYTTNDGVEQMALSIVSLNHIARQTLSVSLSSSVRLGIRFPSYTSQLPAMSFRFALKRIGLSLTLTAMSIYVQASQGQQIQ